MSWHCIDKSINRKVRVDDKMIRHSWTSSKISIVLNPEINKSSYERGKVVVQSKGGGSVQE